MNPDNGHGLAEMAATSGPDGWLRPRTEDASEAAEATETALRLVAANLPLDLKDFIQKIERDIIVRTLASVQGNQKAAARLLGLKHTTLNEKVKRFRIRFRKTPVS
jgi:transcriptional regulator with GAF, ATPase, and Fis domain